MRFLSYIESTGTQYIDTGVFPTQKTRLVIDIDLTPSTGSSALFGARNSVGVAAFCLFARGNGSKYDNYFGSAVTPNCGGENGGRHIIDKNQGALYIDGTLVDTLTSEAFTCNYSIALLQIVQIGGAMKSYPTTAKLYSCQIYNSDVLVRDFVPAESDDGTIGLYDKVNARFYGNAGTDAFIGGEPLNEMFSVNFAGLTNDLTYYARVYPMNPKGYAQAEIGTQVGSAIPKA